MTNDNHDTDDSEQSIEALTENLDQPFDSRRGLLKKGAAASAAGLGLSAGAGTAAASGDATSGPTTALTPKKKFEEFRNQTFILLENTKAGKFPNKRPVACGGSKETYEVFQIFFLGVDSPADARESYLLVPPSQSVEIAQLYTFKGSPKPCDGEEKGKFEFVKVDYEPADLAAQTNQQTQAAQGQDKVNPVAVLNYALVLERLEATFYTRALEKFSQEEIESSEVAQQFGEPVQSSLYKYLTKIRDHEQSHVDYLVKVINKLGGDPVSADQVSFTFPLESPTGFIQTAQTLETVGVSAYDGAINLLKKDDLLTAAATVATVEGRHSAYLNGLVGKPPFPRAFDNAKPPEEIVTMIDPFVESDVKGLLELV